MFFSFRPLGLVLLLLFTPTLWAEAVAARQCRSLRFYAPAVPEALPY